MKHTFKQPGVLLMAAAALLASCDKDVDNVGILNTDNGFYTDNATPLKDLADFPIGTAINYGPWTNDPKFSEVVKRDFNEVVMGYEMKHGAVVQDNGNYDFTQADAMMAGVGTMSVFGHTLCWHQNQNANYLKSFSGITAPAVSELLTNPGFENGIANWTVMNSGNPAGTSTLGPTTVVGEFRSGGGALKVVNPVGYPGSQWRVQFGSDPVTVEPGKRYILSYWVKAQTAGGSIRLSTQYTDGGDAQYQGDQEIGTSWQQISWVVEAASAQLRMIIDMGQAANTYFIDDASIKEEVIPPGGVEVAEKLDVALKDFITTMVGRYKNKVRAWDVYNEPFTDGTVQLRNNSNTPDAGREDILVWSNYLGRDAAFKAFKYAEEADPTAELYINEYNLESNPAKLDSLIAFVQELKSRGARVDGIGTQMHIAFSPSTFALGVDNMMQKLAATGLKIRISELDVRTAVSGNPVKAVGVDQPAVYRYIVSSYLKHIPRAQQAGITVWGVNDANSWLYENGKELPLLYDNNYNKKPAYGAFVLGLKGQ